MAKILPPTAENLQKAAALLKAGSALAFPTETVYGLGADATNDKAVASIYAIKNRPDFNPLIVHSANLDATKELVEFTPLAIKLAAAFWPGPFTLVLKRKLDSRLSLLLSAGLDTVAIRVPAHRVAKHLLEISGLPLAAPSANISLSGMRGLPSAPAYSASKAAVRVYGEGLRGYLQKYGVQVNVICPGYIKTPMTAVNNFPMPFIMEPEKAAKIIANGLAKNKSRIAFPLGLYIPLWLLSCFSTTLTDPLFAALPAKPSQPHV